MTKHTTRWSPDTCDCIIEYEWDDEDTPQNRIHSLSNYVNKCAAHQSLDIGPGFNSVVDENTRKNITLADILNNSPTQDLYDVKNDIDKDGKPITSRQLKPHITYKWSWTGTAPNRTLEVDFDGIAFTTNEKNSITNLLSRNNVELK